MLIKELHELYEKARAEKDKKNHTVAQKAYDKVISQIKIAAQQAKGYYDFTFDTFYHNPEAGDILFERLRKEGLTVYVSDEEYFEVSGWAEEPSNWKKTLKE